MLSYHRIAPKWCLRQFSKGTQVHSLQSQTANHLLLTRMSDGGVPKHQVGFYEFNWDNDGNQLVNHCLPSFF
jgi:hypothetical protein